MADSDGNTLQEQKSFGFASVPAWMKAECRRMPKVCSSGILEEGKIALPK